MLVLNKTQMGLSRKIGLGAFMCLSVAMALIALVRIGGYRIQGKVDTTWQFFWQHIEVCIAIIMGSATAFRTLFVGENSRKTPNKKPSYSIRLRILRKKTPTSEKSDWEDANGRHLPTVPSATLSGLRTFIDRRGRTRVGMKSRRGNWETFPHENDDAHSRSVHGEEHKYKLYT